MFDGRFLSPRELDRDIFTCISLWPELRPWLTGIHPQVVVERPGYHHMTSMDFFSLLDLVVPGPSSQCLSLISYLSPIFDNNRKYLWLRIYWIKSPIRRTGYSSLFHFSIYYFKYWRKPCLGYILLIIELNKFRCWE